MILHEKKRCRPVTGRDHSCSSAKTVKCRWALATYSSPVQSGGIAYSDALNIPILKVVSLDDPKGKGVLRKQKVPGLNHSPSNPTFITPGILHSCMRFPPLRSVSVYSPVDELRNRRHG